MAKYALIQNDGVAEFREVDDTSKVALHKKAPDGGPLLRPVIEDKIPTYRTELAHLSTNIAVNKNTVKITYAVINLPHEQQQTVVKLEANRRILDRFPQWKQTNMVARGIELQKIWSLNGKWTNAESAESNKITQAWNWIKKVRDTSNTLELQNPVPDDFDSNERWPE